MSSVKGYLSSYLHAEQESQYCKMRLSRLQTDCERLTAHGIGVGASTPSRGGPNDERLVNLADLIREYEGRVAEADRLRAEIELFILRLDCGMHRQMLSAIYIDGIQRKNLPHYFRKSRSWCYYTYRRAMKAAQEEFDKRGE